MGKITLQNVSKEYGSLTAVEDLSVELSEGKYIMILGPSGCGKSTTLRMIAGLEDPTEGQIHIDGEDVTNKPPRDRDLSMVFQSLALWNHKTVRENMEFGLKMEGVGSEERDERVEEIADILQISDKLSDDPADLSGGQQQRVALGRSLVREPDVLLLDEPLSSLDAKLRLEMRSELARIQRELETTFVHVTHNQEDAMTIADEMLILNNGQKQQHGESLHIYDNPANEFVANFIGTPGMNILSADIKSNQNYVEIDSSAFKVSLPDEHQIYGFDGSARVGIRPDDLSLSSPEQDWPSIEGEVNIVETFGDYNWYHVDVGLPEEIVIQAASDRMSELPDRGENIKLKVDPERIHVFDPQSGDKLV